MDLKIKKPSSKGIKFYNADAFKFYGRRSLSHFFKNIKCGRQISTGLIMQQHNGTVPLKRTKVIVLNKRIEVFVRVLALNGFVIIKLDG